MRFDLITLQQLAQYWLRRLGLPMVLGVLLIAYALGFYVGVGLQADRRLQYVNKHSVQMRAAIAQRQQSWVAESPRAALQTFYHLLPSAHNAPDLLEKIFTAAYDSDLEMYKGEFKLAQADKDAAFLRYQVSLPVTGSYVNIRKFVNRVLREMPFATLDTINFSREDAYKSEVQAKVYFTLFLGVKR